jgi:hypothetical protein
MWSRTQPVVYYVSEERLHAARLEFEPSVRVVDRWVVLDPFSPRWAKDYDVHPDGNLFVLARPRGAPVQREIVVVQNWLAELRRIAAD